MEWTVGVEQVEETKTKSFWLLGLHCGEATHWETDLEMRREPDDGGGGFISYEIVRLSFFAQNKKLSSVMCIYLRAPAGLRRRSRWRWFLCSHPLEEGLWPLPAAPWRWHRLCTRCCNNTLRVRWSGTWRYLRGLRGVCYGRIPDVVYIYLSNKLKSVVDRKIWQKRSTLSFVSIVSGLLCLNWNLQLRQWRHVYIIRIKLMRLHIINCFLCSLSVYSAGVSNSNTQ